MEEESDLPIYIEPPMDNENVIFVYSSAEEDIDDDDSVEVIENVAKIPSKKRSVSDPTTTDAHNRMLFLTGVKQGFESHSKKLALQKPLVKEPHADTVYYFHQEGCPKTWRRPRFLNWIKNGMMFRRVVGSNKSDVVAIQEVVKDNLLAHYGIADNLLPIFRKGIPVVLAMEFHRRPPNSWFRGGDRRCGTFKQKYQEMAIGDMVIADLKRPDLDNMSKLILDSLQGIMFEDDDQVIKISSVEVVHTSHPFEGKTTFSVCKWTSLESLSLLDNQFKAVAKPIAIPIQTKKPVPVSLNVDNAINIDSDSDMDEATNPFVI